MNNTDVTVGSRSSFVPLIEQFVRFVGIGFLNTGLSFAILNVLMSYSGIYTGAAVGFFSVVAFCIAVLHSFYWNKHWAFNGKGISEDASGFFKSVWQFVIAAALGFAVFVAVVFGSRQGFGTIYYMLLILALAVGEIMMWEFFHVGKDADQVLKQSRREFMFFLVISVIGAFINYAILSYCTVHIPPKFGIGQQLWTNVIQAFAIGISLVWNFVGYKIFVFKKT